MQLFYRLLFLPAFLLSLPYYLSRMLRRGGYGRDIRHRFGLVPKLPPSKGRRIWIQAVSVGEINALSELLPLLLTEGYELVLTTTTSTGYALAHKRYADSPITLAYFPVDFWPISALCWRRFRPDLAVLMEAEIWPEHTHQAQRRNVPLLLINARLSDRSFERYGKASLLADPLFERIDRILPSSEADAERFEALGYPADRLQVTGNLKFDAAGDEVISEVGRKDLQEELGLQDHRQIIIGSSTWPGEEAFLLELLSAARNDGHPVGLLIVPRHAERREEIRPLLESSQFSFHFRSDARRASKPVDIAVADTTGELSRLIQLADIAFIGKSLPPCIGGQTPIEAAAYGIPIVYGPSMSNFRQACRELEQAGAAQRCSDGDKAGAVILELLSKQADRQAMSERARKWHQRNLGATKRTLAVLKAMLP